MWEKIVTGILLCYLLAGPVSAQDNNINAGSNTFSDSAQITKLLEEPWESVPERAALLSFILPGSGQAYNRSWWKVPIIYGGLGISAWVISDNKRNYDLFRSAYNNRVQDLPDPFIDIYPNLNTLSTIRDTYYKWYQLSIIVTAAIYLMNGIEAYVDAHLKNFEISEDLSFSLPLNSDANAPFQVPFFGVTITLH